MNHAKLEICFFFGTFALFCWNPYGRELDHVNCKSSLQVFFPLLFSQKPNGVELKVQNSKSSVSGFILFFIFSLCFGSVFSGTKKELSLCFFY